MKNTPKPAALAHLHERTLTSEEIYHGGFLRLMRDQVELANGCATTREYVVHPGAVAVVPLLEHADGTLELVLERQFRYPLQQVMIEFPAGKIDPGEAPLQCAQRELHEETGYQASAWARAGVLHPVVAYSTEAIEIWFAKGLTAGVRQLDDNEMLDVFRTSPEQLLRWCQDGSITDAKTLIAAFWLQNVLSGVWTLDWQPASAA